MIPTLRGVKRIGHSDHYINKILEHPFTQPKNNCVEVILVFDIVKKLIANVLCCHQQTKLSRKLQTLSSARFSGAYYVPVSCSCLSWMCSIVLLYVTEWV